MSYAKHLILVSLLSMSCRSPMQPTLTCDLGLWDRTYSHERFHVWSLCAHEVHRVTEVWFSEDGDLVWDAIDVSGAFVHDEVPCARAPDPTDSAGREVIAQHVCDGVIPTTQPPMPAVGTCVEVAGPNVQDLRHNWREIHGVVWRQTGCTR
jgi:hypothetical protein